MDTHEIFNDSYTRCLRNNQFFFIFYRHFWQQERRFKDLFQDVDLERQVQMLKLSISMIILASSSEQARESIRRFGKAHGPDGIGVQPNDFEVWLDSLIETVQICDPKYNDEIAFAWRECFKEGIAIMKQECL
ncbi:globin [Photobacterium sp. DNB23_23_1]|uniref:Globin n=1 Tax=Photobacterium pectinilyticum TaxID=2906793 RepID=A0ABT1N9I6_9GAMM|nr:globin [Photobacterium sp. ZSDE20]MCQ1060356.1 globin [Photobacterium sp. ZSDE20]MDD1826888.1 globin [Photobacterium sp. ZSDE20]